MPGAYRGSVFSGNASLSLGSGHISQWARKHPGTRVSVSSEQGPRNQQGAIWICLFPEKLRPASRTIFLLLDFILK